MAKKYEPPFDMTDRIINLSIDIAEVLGKIDERQNIAVNPKLRRDNRIKSIHSSLAIEQNTLTEKQVNAVINGKNVRASEREIQEVRNAFAAYEMLSELNMSSTKDLLKAHKVMMRNLAGDAGSFRTGNVGVFAGDKLIHAGTPAKYVPDLMKELMHWLKTTEISPLISACLFHYEFEFIHPFSDGNGRMGRLWNTLILASWRPVLMWIPIESIVRENQKEYYSAIERSDKNGSATVFVEFMLKVIRNALCQVRDSSHSAHNAKADQAQGLDKSRKLRAMIKEEMLANSGTTAADIATKLGVTEGSIRHHIRKMKEDKEIRREGSTKAGTWKVLK